ncbi:MAG: cell division topological specificity factor MinE [Proteobacteria bacterium]|nr:cell division topological specificity factor MinE [Pseudomonadota bacterium]
MKWINKLMRGGSADTAKGRLKIVIAQERSSKKGQPDFLPLLHKEILAVIEKYMRISSDMVEVDFSHQDRSAVLKLNVILPDEVKAKS